MGFFKSKEEKAAEAKAYAAKVAKEAKAKAERLAKQAEERKIKQAEEARVKHNENLTKTGINAKDVDPTNYQAVLIEQNNMIMMYLENIAIMNSNLLNNPILATNKALRNKQLARYHKEYKNA